MDFLLGSGTSVQAGIPSGGALVWEFKRMLYCTVNGMREERFKDLESERNRQILQEYCDSQHGYPHRDAADEYNFYFEKCYPSSLDRKHFVQRKVSNINPSLGHLCLGSLLKSGKTTVVWTTNFDELIESGAKAIDTGISMEIASPENIQQVASFETPYPKILKLHGDYRYDALMNTLSETQQLDSQLRDQLLARLKTKGLIVVGYSGNDTSIMSVLREAASEATALPFGLVWCVRKNQKPDDTVVELLAKVSSQNKLSGLVEVENFDVLLYDLYNASGIRMQKIDGIAEVLFQKRKPFAARQAEKSAGAIKLNALRVTKHPRSLYSFQSNLTGWQQLRQRIAGKNVVAALSKGKTYAFGKIDDIKDAFKDTIQTEILFADIEPHWLYNQDSFLFGMLYDLIDHSLRTHCGLQSHSYQYQRTYYSETREIKPDKNKWPSTVKVYEGFECQLSFNDGHLWFLLWPTVQAVDTRNDKLLTEGERLNARKVRQSIVNDILSRRYNKIANDKLVEWLRILKGSSKSIEFALGEFSLTLAPEFAYGGLKTSDSVDFFQRMFHLDEPRLMFHASDGNRNSIHPLKGLKMFGPLDGSFETRSTQRSAIKLGIICPDDGVDLLLGHLNGLRDACQNTSEKEYLIEYSGYDSVYRRFLDVPNGKSSKFCTCVSNTESQTTSPIAFYNVIKRKIDYFDTLKGEFDVLVIYFPDKWANFREIKDEQTYFNLHDSVKIYCAKKNIKVQFVEDKSIKYFDKAKVKWWLSLGLYVKANGTPWKTTSTDNRTAYIGIGFAIKGRKDSSRTIIGSSQIFDSSGQGLRFLLQPIEKPVIIRDNAFMSREDARRLITRLKESYFWMDPNARLERVVIHKTTHFTRDEMEGIAQGLEGIPDVELLQIQHLTHWRGIRGDMERKLPHLYPVLRGTVVQVDDSSFLLWTHGSIQNEELAGKGRNYYQGGRAIPSPLLIRRFRGHDPIEKTASEILSLTKMNWNSGGLYKVLPVTLDFSKILSRMAKQTESLQDMPYDFRFFM
jgi:hypothetical protein